MPNTHSRDFNKVFKSDAYGGNCGTETRLQLISDDADEYMNLYFKEEGVVEDYICFNKESILRLRDALIEAYPLDPQATQDQDPEARTSTQDIELRDALLRRYPLTPTADRYEAVHSVGGEWMVIRRYEATAEKVCRIAEDLTEDHARIFADAMNAKATA